MSTLLYFFKAWTIGIAIAAIIGPIGILCIKKTLELGLRGACLVGLGAAAADSVYGIVAATSLIALSHHLSSHTPILKILGGFFLLYLSYKEAKSSITITDTKTREDSNAKLVLSVFFLTLSSPLTILSFVGIFASITSGPTSTLESMSMVAGIFFGSMTWWVLLGTLITKTKHMIPESWISRIKWGTCFILFSFSMFSLLDAAKLVLKAS